MRLKRYLVLSLVLATGVNAFAASVDIKIGNEGWSVFFDAPRLSKRQELTKPGEFTFSASAGRLSVSLLVQQKPDDGGTRNRDAYQYFWSKASQNPTIAKETVIATEITKYLRVEYDIVVNVLDKSIRQKNVNYYFAFRNRWADLHISMLRPTESDARIFAVFDETFGYGQ